MTATVLPMTDDVLTILLRREGSGSFLIQLELYTRYLCVPNVRIIMKCSELRPYTKLLRGKNPHETTLWRFVVVFSMVERLFPFTAYEVLTSVLCSNVH